MTRIYTQKESKNIAKLKAIYAKVQAEKKLAARRRIEEIHNDSKNAKAM